jgi:hypothetical protein
MLSSTLFVSIHNSTSSLTKIERSSINGPNSGKHAAPLVSRDQIVGILEAEDSLEFHSTTCKSTVKQNCFKKEHLAQCEHPDCLPTKDWPGRAFQTKLGCTIHTYREGWNLNYQPGYSGPINYVRPPVTQVTPAAMAQPPPTAKPKGRTKRLKR